MFVSIGSKTGNTHVRLMLDVVENIEDDSLYSMSRLEQIRKSVCSELPGPAWGVFLRICQNHPQMLSAISACVLGHPG